MHIPYIKKSEVNMYRITAISIIYRDLRTRFIIRDDQGKTLLTTSRNFELICATWRWNRCSYFVFSSFRSLYKRVFKYVQLLASNLISLNSNIAIQNIIVAMHFSTCMLRYGIDNTTIWINETYEYFNLVMDEHNEQYIKCLRCYGRKFDC